MDDDPNGGTVTRTPREMELLDKEIVDVFLGFDDTKTIFRST